MVNIDIDEQENIHYFSGFGHYLEMLIMTLSEYLIVTKEIVSYLWQYVEFRILVFIFACVSCIPLILFLVFWTCLTCLTVFVSASLWLLVSTMALFVFFPFLIGSMGVAVGLVLAYQVCIITKVYLALIFNSSNNDENDDNLVICNDKK